MTTTEQLRRIREGQGITFLGSRSPDKVPLERWGAHRYKIAAQLRWAVETQTLLDQLLPGKSGVR